MTPLKGVEVLGVRKKLSGYVIDFRVDGYAYLDDWQEDSPYTNEERPLDYHTYHTINAKDELDALSQFMEAWNRKEVIYR